MTLINLSGHLDFISWSPTLASVKLLLDSLLYKTEEKE